MNRINEAPDFSKIAKELLKRLPHDVGQLALSHFKGSFRKQGFTDYAFISWPQRLDHFPHPLLRKTDNLMNSVKVTSETMQRVQVATEEKYAAIHNNGAKFSILVTPKMRKYFWYMFKKTGQEKWKAMAITKKKRLPIRIPQRQFIGNSQVLNRAIDKHLIDLILKKFNSTL